MKWKLTRKLYREDGIFGELVSEDGTHIFQTLEHAYQTDDGWYPKVQEGVHPCIIYQSPKHGYNVPLLNALEDQGHTYELHSGNYNADSIGCILVGLTQLLEPNGVMMITGSKTAFGQIMALGVSGIEVFGAI